MSNTSLEIDLNRELLNFLASHIGNIELFKTLPLDHRFNKMQTIFSNARSTLHLSNDQILDLLTDNYSLGEFSSLVELVSTKNFGLIHFYFYQFLQHSIVNDNTNYLADNFIQNILTVDIPLYEAIDVLNRLKDFYPEHLDKIQSLLDFINRPIHVEA